MSTEENKAVVRRFLEGPGSGQGFDNLDALIGPGYKNHGLEGNAPAMGFEESKHYAKAFFTAFPDGHATVEEMAAEGDLVATRYTWTGTHRGELQGIPAMGKQVRVTGISLHRIQNGKIVEDWPGLDMLGLLQQIGAIPQPEQHPA